MGGSRCGERTGVGGAEPPCPTWEALQRLPLCTPSSQVPARGSDHCPLVAALTCSACLLPGGQGGARAGLDPPLRDLAPSEWLQGLVSG